MAGQLTLRVITPEKVAVDTTADSLRFPAIDGLMGVLPKHAAMIAALDVGELTYQAGGREHALFVSGGFVEVRDNTVRLVTQAGEAAEDIDEERARAAEKRAREKLDAVQSGGAKDVDLIRAQAALRRAILRLRIRERT